MVKLAFYRELPRFLIVFIQYNSKASLISIFQTHHLQIKESI